MFELKALKEELADVTSDLNNLAATIEREARNFSEEEISQFDKLDNQRNELTTKIATAERLERSRGVNVPNRMQAVSKGNKRNNGIERRNALRGFLLAERAPHEWQELAAEYGYRLDRNSISKTDFSDCFATISRTDYGQDLGTSGHGGETIDGDVFVGILTRLKRYGNVQKVSRQLTTANGNPIHYAFADDVSNSASIIGENTAPSSVPVAYSKVALSSYTYRSLVEPVSYELIQDSLIDITEDITEKLVVRLGRRMNLDWTTGSGSGQPTGFVTAASAGVTTSYSNGFTYTDLNNLLHSVDPDYRDKDDGKVCLMMNDATLAFMERNFHDSNGRPYFLGPQSYGNITDPAPLRIAVSGQVFPIVINQAMPSIGAGNSPVAFGWFGAYVTRLVADVRIDVYRERYADLGAIGVQAFARADGNLIDTNAIKLLTLAGSGSGTFSMVGDVAGLKAGSYSEWTK